VRAPKAVIPTRAKQVDSQLVSESLDVLARHARSFRWAAVFLPPAARKDAAVLYAFLRNVDDAVDEAKCPSDASRELERLRTELTEPGPVSALSAAVLELAARRGFGLAPLLDLFEGMRTDLGPVRVQSASELELYCYRVAGTVGFMMTHILGVSNGAVARHAVSLGVAMQLTNICRDVLEDADRDRLYLPESYLSQGGGVRENLVGDIAAKTVEPATRDSLRRVVAQLLARAEELYDFASLGLGFLAFRSRIAVLLAALLYREIGRTLLAERGGDPLRGRVKVSFGRKLGLSCEAVLRVLISRLRLGKSVATSLGPDPFVGLPLP